MASHELKTPITSTMGGLQFLLHYSGLQMTEQQRDIMTSAYDGVIQLKRIVDDLLSISRIESQGLSVVKAPVNVNRLAKEIYESFSLPLSERRINVSVAIDETPVPIDEGFYKLAVRNLLENAIKFTPDGGSIHLEGTIISRSELQSQEDIIKEFYPEFPNNVGNVEHFYRFTVTDSGIGVPNEERHRIFDKFYGVGDIAYHSSGQTDFMSKGSGLGLAIVKGVLDGHGGMVWVTEGADGTGSVFTLLVPLE
jgi:signal transduction histidine kinase